MKLSTSWLLPAFIAATSASLEASVYLLQADNLPESSNPPTLSPEQARLVFAQRLGASKYHNLEDATATTLSYINKFGGEHASLFGDLLVNRARELVLIVDGLSAEDAEPLLEAWATKKPAFFISSPPSAGANYNLVDDMAIQIHSGTGWTCSLEDEINPFTHCWGGESKIFHYDLSESKNTIAKLLVEQKRMAKFAEQDAMNVMVVLMPKSTITSKASKHPYGIYDMPDRAQKNLGRRHGGVEEPMNGAFMLASTKPNRASNTRSNSTLKPITGVPPVCHSSLESCTKKTNDCSGHGSCYQKRAGGNACFACGCKPNNVTFIHGKENRTGVRIAYWGGAACQKEDISGPFWLISIFTIVMVGLVSWSIGLMYSIGEEKLPGVIGAGVSTNRAR